MNQKRRVVFIPMGIVLLFLIAACDGGGGDAIGGAPTTPFLGGSQGLVIEFLEGSPPDEVTDGNTFPFQAVVSLRNEGEFDLITSDVKVSLIGFLPSDFGANPTDLVNQPPEQNPTSRKRDSEGNIIEPVETFRTFPSPLVFFNFASTLAGNTAFIFRADVCYKYQTDVVSEICVLENLINVADDAICDPSESKSVFSSGSPVKVTSFRQSVAGKDRIQFSFDIDHSGSGNVFDLSTFADCPKDSTQRRLKEDFVNVVVNTGLGIPQCGLLINCGGNTACGNVKLVNGKRTITCTQNLAASRTDFIKNIDITLKFNYLDNVDKEVLVKHIVS